MARREQRLLALLAPSVEDLGYELVDVEFHAAPKSGVLRLYIDGPEGVGLEDCEAVSRQVGAVLDVEDPIPGNYNLEVSSPGLDRVLRTPAHFAQFVGSEVVVRTRAPLDGRRKFTGTLSEAGEERIAVTVDGQSVAIELAQIEKARLVPDYSQLL